MNQYRKKLLMAVGAVMGLYFGGEWLLTNMLEIPLEMRRAQTARLNKEIESKQVQMEKLRRSSKELESWKARSLPSNLEVARSLYQAWLLELVGHVGFSNPNVDSNEPINRKDRFHVLVFSLRGRGTLAQLTRFLYEFYSTDHMHQIRSLGFTPLGGSDQLDLTVSIEALVLPQADRKDHLASHRSDRLASPRLEDYQVIVQRNLFGATGGADISEFTFLTAVNYVDGQPEAWFSVRTNDTILKLRKGEGVEIGQFKASIAEITDADVILESDGERWLLTIGERLTQAAALPPEY